MCWGGALTNCPCKLRLKFFLRPGSAGAPTAPPGYAYDILLFKRINTNEIFDDNLDFTVKLVDLALDYERTLYIHENSDITTFQPLSNVSFNFRNCR